MSTHRRYLLAFPSLSLAIAIALSPSFAFAADFPLGSYAYKTITISFDNKGHFRVLDGKDMRVRGDYRVKGDQLELTDTSGPWACTKDGQKTGTYSWKYEQSALTLTKVADLCDERVGTLTPTPWKAKPH